MRSRPRPGCWLWAAAFALLVLAPMRAHADPPEDGPTVTRIGAFVAALADISEAQRRFDVTFWVWMLSDRVGGPDPGKTLEVVNAVGFDRQHTVTTTSERGSYTQVKFRASVRNRFDFRDFPFDRHTLRIELEDAERDDRSLQFVPDIPPGGGSSLTLGSDLDPQDWTIGAAALSTVVHTEPTNFGDVTQAAESSYSRVVLEIDIARKHSLRILMTLLLGTFMGSLVAFLAVLLPIQQSPPRYTLLSSALFVCIANRLLVDTRLPAGSSLGLLDQLQLASIVGLLLLAGASMWLTNAAEKRIPPARATQLSQRIGWGWMVALLVVQIAMVLAHAA